MLYKDISMKIKKMLAFLSITACISTLLLNGCAPQMGTQSAKTTATGSVAGSHTENVNPLLERCDNPLGTLAVNEDYSKMSAFWAIGNVNRYGQQSTVPILRLLAQQSGCFVVVGRGNDLNNMMTERRLAASGQLRKKSNIGKGQMVAADYTVEPTVIFKTNRAGGLGMMAGAFVPVFGPLVGMAASSLNTKNAQTMLTLVDNRSGIQVAVAEGSSSSFDIGGLFGMLGKDGLGGLGGYTNTPEGKLIVASMTDSFNNLVRATRNYKPQQATGPHGMGTGGKMTVK